MHCVALQPIAVHLVLHCNTMHWHLVLAERALVHYVQSAEEGHVSCPLQPLHYTLIHYLARIAATL